MESFVLSFLKAEWKVSDTGSAHWASSYKSYFPLNVEKSDFWRHISWSFYFVFIFNDFWWEVIVRFVDIGEILDHHWLNYLLIIFRAKVN